MRSLYDKQTVFHLKKNSKDVVMLLFEFFFSIFFSCVFYISCDFIHEIRRSKIPNQYERHARTSNKHDKMKTRNEEEKKHSSQFVLPKQMNNHERGLKSLEEKESEEKQWTYDEQINSTCIHHSHLARISASLKMKYSLSSISTFVPPYSGKRTLSPA
jgi:hypothetical protein